MNLDPSTFPKTSVVVLCYNGLEEVTRPCIESILKNTAAGSYELVLVDNASVDGTAEYLTKLAKNHAHVKVQLNDINKGYAGGNNDGIRLSQGAYIVLLNNDTLVPNGWLERLLHLLETQPDIGLVGPITNSAGNEQRVDLAGLNEENFESTGAQYARRQSGHWFTTEKLGFFCVALRRSLVDEVGVLDEQFGIGMFEDDDYCIRVRRQGYRLAVDESCFVFHKGSISFKKLSVETYFQLFSKNREYFFQKHGRRWLFSDIAMAIWEKISADLKSYNESGDRAAIERAGVRQAGMSGALAQLSEVESRLGDVGGRPGTEMELIEKKKQLMEMSDWASGMRTELVEKNQLLAEMSDRASSMRAELVEKHRQLMEMSDWASGMKRQLDKLSSSRFYRLMKWVEKKRI